MAKRARPLLGSKTHMVAAVDLAMVSTEHAILMQPSKDGCCRHNGGAALY